MRRNNAFLMETAVESRSKAGTRMIGSGNSGVAVACCGELVSFFVVVASF